MKRGMKWILTACLLTLLIPGSVSGGDLTLKDAISRAISTSPLVEAAKGGLDEFEADYKRARLAWLPVGKVDMIGSATPRKYGDPMEGHTDMEEWGPFLGIYSSAVLPIFTFGKVAALKAMARAGVSVGRAQVKTAEDEIRYLTTQAYFSLVFASEIEDIIRDGEKYLNKARDYLDQLEEEDSDDYDQIDRLRLKVYQADISGRRLQASRMGKTARTALSILTGLPPEAIKPAMKKIKPVGFGKWKLDELEKLAVKHRPELRALASAIRAAELGRTYARRQWYPDIFVTGTYSWAKAWAVEGQPSPFAYDPYNSWFGGGGLGLRWKLDLGERLGAMDKASARVRKLTGQRDAYLQRLRLTLAERLGEARDAEQLMELNRRAHKAARGWVIAKTDLYEAGMVELKDVTEGLTKFYTFKLAYRETIVRHNLAVARLARECGVNLDTLAKYENP